MGGPGSGGGRARSFPELVTARGAAVGAQPEPGPSPLAFRYVPSGELGVGDDTSPPGIVLPPGNLAQIIYTSGTGGKTGMRPVAVPHPNVICPKSYPQQEEGARS